MLKFFKKRLPSAVGIEIIERMISIAQKTPEGCFVEVGVYKGGTASHLTELAMKQKRKIYLYDTFEGMPFHDEIDVHRTGDFSDTDYNSVRFSLPYANVIKGIFPQSAIEMPKIAFAHLDVDQYLSYKCAIGYIKNKMANGGVIWIDDYSMKGCQLAIQEEFKEIIRIGNQAMIKI